MTMTPNARKRAKRSSLALALEPRILLDAAAVATAADVAAQVDVNATDTAPGLEVSPTRSTVTIDDNTTSFPPVNLFDNVDVSLDSGDQLLAELVITVNSSGANQALVVDGKQLALTANTDDNPFTANGYQYSVNVTGGTTTITLNFESDGGITAEAAEQLIDGLQFHVLDKSVDSSTIKVTLNSLEDTGGQTITLDASATIIIDNQINVAPVLENDGALDARETFTPDELGIGNTAEVAYSADGKYAYVAGTNGIQVFSVDGSGALTALQSFTNSNLGSVTHLAASADGTSLYTISGDTNIIHMNLGEDGRITSATVIAGGNGATSGGLAISDDSQYVYVGTSNNDVAIYVRDAATGGLSHLDLNGDGHTDRAPGSGGGSNTRNGVVITSGDHVYVAYGHTGSRILIAYQRNDNGTLSEVANYTFSTGSSGAVDYSLAVSSDGQHLYVSDPEHNVIRVFRLSDGQLAQVETITQNHVSSIALGNDGKTLYATSSDGTLNVYAVATNGTLDLASSVSTNTSGSDIVVAADGSLLVAGGNLTRYTSIQSLNLGQPTTFAEGLTFKDSNYDALNDGAGNYKGASITFSSNVSGGSFGFADGGSLTQSGTTISLDGAAIASFNVDANGKLTIAFTADTSKAIANQVLQQLTYTSAAGTVAGSLVTLTIQGSDGLLASNTMALLLRANEAPKVNPDVSPTLEPVKTETGYSVVLPANLFTDTSNDKLTWTLTGLPDDLSFDPATRTISGTTTEIGTFKLTITVTDTSGLSATRDVDIVVEQIGNRAPEVSASAPETLPSVTVGTDGYSQELPSNIFSDADAIYSDSTLTWSVGDLPAGLSFDSSTRTLSGAPSTVGDYTITVTVTDEHGATAEHTLTLRVISQAEADNTAPVLGTDNANLSYTVEGNLSGFSQNVYDLELSPDDKTLLIVGNNATGHSVTPNGNSTLYVYSRDSEGNLTLVQKFVQGTNDDGDNSNGIEINGLDSASSAVYSADGQHVYLVGKNSSGAYTVTTLRVNADGSLATTDLSITLADSSTVRQMVVSDDGKALYIISNNSLSAYATGADGSLSLLGNYTDGINTSNALTIANGVLYVAGNTRVAIYTINDNGALNYSTTYSGGNNFMRSIAASDNGYVYVSLGAFGNVLVLHYDKTTSEVTRVASYSSPSQTYGLSLSADGTALYAGLNGGGIRVYSVNADGTLTQTSTLATSGAQALRYAMSSDGSSIYYGSFWNGTGLGQISTLLGATYTEGSTAQPFANINLSDANYDSLSSGAGNYNGATITLQREGTANTNDSFGLSENNGLTLVEGEVRLNGEKIASLSNADGKLTIVFTADVNTATANAVLRQITYSNASNDPGASIRLTLGVKDQFTSGTDSITLTLTVAQVNDAPEVTATPRPDVSQDAGKAAVALFSDAQISAVEQGQLISGLTFTVSGLKDGANETLRIDGTSIPLVAGSGTTSSGHVWSVAIDADSGAATVTLSSAAGLTAASASALVNGTAYANADKATGTAGVRTITLTSVKDNGGTANGGQDTRQLQISNTVDVTVGQSPTLSAEVGSVDIAQELLSSDDYQDLVGVVQSGDLVYAVRNGTTFDYETFSNVPVSTLYVFQRNADGSLEQIEQIDANAQNGLLGARSLSLSADGSTLYIVTDSGLALFSRDGDSGAVTALGLVATDLSPLNDVHIDGDVAYVTSNDGITLLRRDGDGWSVDGVALTAPGDTWFTDIQVSADGRFLFAATSGGETLLSAFRIGADGALEHITDVDGPSDEHYASQLTLSPDGSTLYVIDEDSLHVLSVAENGTFSLVGEPIELPGDARQLLVSADGHLVVVVTEKLIALYARADNGTLTRQTQVSALSELDFKDLSTATFSQDGTQLYLTGTFGWDSGLLVLDLKPASVTYVEGADATALLPSASYNAALNANSSIVIERSGGAQDTDRFTFLEDNNLRLVNGQILSGTTVIASFVQVDGKLTLTFSSDATQSQAQDILRQIAYDNLEGEPAKQMSFSVSINDGSATTAQTATLNQIVALLPGGTLSDPQLDALGSGAGNYKGASIVVSREGEANTHDVFDFLNGNGLEFRDGAIWRNGVSIASVVEANGTLTVTFTGDVSRADAQQVLRSIAYRNTSDDPTADSDKANFTIRFNDGSGHSDEHSVEITLVGVNDPAIVETTARTPTFNAEGERVPLFENTSIDTVEAGQNIQRVIVTITGVTAGDILGIDGGKIDLAKSVDGNVRVGQSGIQYMVSYNANTGTTTVTLYVSRSAEGTAEVIDSLSYGHTGNETSGQRNISLSIVESVDNWRENATTNVLETAVVTLTAATETNTPPTVGGTPESVPYTEQQDPVLIAPEASIGDTQLDRFNNGDGNYDGATLTITLGEGKSSADILGFKAGNGLTLVGDSLQKGGQVIGSVTVADGVMTITFSDAQGVIPTTADVENTLRQITYANSSDVPAASVEVSIKLADQRGLESAVEDLAIVITPVNDAPVINDDPILSLGDLELLKELTDIPGLSTPTSSVVSGDGSRVYVADSQGNIALFNRNTETGELTHVQTLPGQQEVVRLQLSADGNSLYVLQVDGNANTIAWFTVGTDGTLQAQGSFSESLWNIKDFALSDDGKNLYLIHTTNLYIYNRDLVTGAISLASTLGGSMTDAPYMWDPREIVSRGDLVFVVTYPSNGSTLIVYQRDANGNLNALAHIHSGNADANGKTITLDMMQHITVSADGRTIFVANSRTSSYSGWTGETTIENHPQQVDAFSLDPDTGELTHLGTINDTPTVEDIALSSDGKALFVTRADGSLAYYSAITLEKLDSSQSGLHGANHISVSADGGVIVTGNSLIVLNAPAVPGPTLEVNGAPVVLFPTLTLNDAELDAANNYQGASVTISGQAGDQFGFLDNDTYRLDGERVLRGDVEVATLVQNGNSTVLSFAAGVSQSEATALLRQVTYTSTSAVPGSHDVSIVFNDGEANSPARNVEVTLLAGNQAPVVNDPNYALSNAKAGQAYTPTPLPANLFSDPDGDSLTWEVTGLPQGLSYDPATRTISGTTTLMGEHRVTLTATDSRNASVTLELTLVVENSVPVVGRDYTPPRATPGADYSATLPADLFTDANDSELTWEIVEQPEWLSYDADSRTLSGTAPDSAGSYSITIKASDSHGGSVTLTLALRVANEEPTASETVLPELHTSTPQPGNAPTTASFGGPALNAPLFEQSDEQGTGNDQTPDPVQPAVTSQNLLRGSTGSGLADGRGSLSEQLLNADRVLTDSGYQDARGSFSFDGTTLRSSVDLTQGSGSSVSLQLPVEPGTRITQSNGMPLPRGVSFDSRTGELRIDRERLQRDGVLRLTLFSRDAEGNEQRTPVEIRAEGAPARNASEAPQAPAAQVESLPQRLQQETSSALLSDALDLLDQLSDLAGEPVVITTRHSA